MRSPRILVESGPIKQRHAGSIIGGRQAGSTSRIASAAETLEPSASGTPACIREQPHASHSACGQRPGEPQKTGAVALFTEERGRPRPPALRPHHLSSPHDLTSYSPVGASSSGGTSRQQGPRRRPRAPVPATVGPTPTGRRRRPRHRVLPGAVTTRMSSAISSESRAAPQNAESTEQVGGRHEDLPSPSYGPPDGRDDE